MRFEITVLVKAKNENYASNKCVKFLKGIWLEPLRWKNYQYTLLGTLEFDSEDELYQYFSTVNKDISLFHSENSEG